MVPSCKLRRVPFTGCLRSLLILPSAEGARNIPVPLENIITFKRKKEKQTSGDILILIKKKMKSNANYRGKKILL